ncbi:MAG: response regulator [Nannocystaceae bacterium]|nr:response regulator [Myxococcales bacterium]
MGWKEYKQTGKVRPDSKLANLSLLIVDDEPGILKSLSESFRGLFNVYTADSGDKALRIFKERDIHVILSDQRMPVMTGVELFAILKAINPYPVRILLTGYSDIKVVVRGLNEALMWKYVTKPWNTEDLKALVRQGARHYLKLAEDAGIEVKALQ